MWRRRDGNVQVEKGERECSVCVVGYGHREREREEEEMVDKAMEMTY